MKMSSEYRPVNVQSLNKIIQTQQNVFLLFFGTEVLYCFMKIASRQYCNFLVV